MDGGHCPVVVDVALADVSYSGCSTSCPSGACRRSKHLLFVRTFSIIKPHGHGQQRLRRKRPRKEGAHGFQLLLWEASALFDTSRTAHAAF